MPRDAKRCQETPRDAKRCHEMPRAKEIGILLDVIIKAIVHLCPPIKNDGTATFILDHVLLIASSILEDHQIMIMIMSITHLVFGIAMGFSENNDVCPFHPLVNN